MEPSKRKREPTANHPGHHDPSQKQTKSTATRKFPLLSVIFAFILLAAVAIQWHILSQTHTILPTTQTQRKKYKAPAKTGTKKNNQTKTGGWVKKKKNLSRDGKDKIVAENLKPQKIAKEKTSMQSEEKDASKTKTVDAKQSDHTTTTETFNRNKNNSLPYLIDPLCGGCRSLKMPQLLRGLHQERCGSLIYRTAQNRSINLLEAAEYVVYQQKYTDCLPCLDCQPHQKHYWRYDKVAPPLGKATTHYFKSVPPDQYRVPASVLRDAVSNKNKLADHFASLNAQPGQAPKPYLFEYNPSIVPLPHDVVKLLQHSYPDETDTPVYLASYRLATTQGCFNVNTTLQMIGGDWLSDQRPQKKDYVGLLLLRDDLSVIDEAVVDLPRPFHKREDFRLFVLYDQLYLATYCKLTRLWIYPKTMDRQHQAYFTREDTPTVWKAINVFPSALKVRIGAAITHCAKETSDNKQAKNLNYFVDPFTNETLVDYQPLGPHILRRLPHVQNASAPTPNRRDDITDNHTLPTPSFYTLEELVLSNEFDFHEVPFTTDRGGACCIAMNHPHDPHHKLWVGISHVKTPHKRRKLEKRLASNQYLSRWYAFEQVAPYRIVAVSGYFCLPATPGIADANNHDNPLAPHAAATNSWQMGSFSMECPVIHFVTGMTEKVNDPDTLIVAYGVGDCTGWFVEINKADILQLLFDGPLH